VKVNLPRLVEAVREGGMTSMRFRQVSGDETVPEGVDPNFGYFHAPGEIMRLSDVRHTDSPYMLGLRSRTPGMITLGGRVEEQFDGVLHLGSYISTAGRSSQWKCFTGKGKATKVAEFYPDSHYCLADLAGVKPDDLPEVLRHWTSFSSYVGNSILSPVDPMNWYLKNPWRRILFRVRLNMSDSTYRKITDGTFKMPEAQA
jgi:hypothetical protein